MEILNRTIPYMSHVLPEGAFSLLKKGEFPLNRWYEKPTSFIITVKNDPNLPGYSQGALVSTLTMPDRGKV